MAKINTIGNASGSLTIDPQSASDSWVQFAINGTNKFRIGTDDTDDSFLLVAGNALGSSQRIRIAANREITFPLQPAGSNATEIESNVTGDGTVHDVGSVTASTEIVDQNNDMTLGDGAGTGATFTAPVDGIYLITYILRAATSSNGTEQTRAIKTTGATYRISNLPSASRVSSFGGNNNDIAASGAVMVELTASDTVVFQITANGTTKDVAARNQNVYGATLIC